MPTLILRVRVLRVNMIYQVYVTQDNNDLREWSYGYQRILTSRKSENVDMKIMVKKI